jgi:GNAT superfamily N-acetyltransferase
MPLPIRRLEPSDAGRIEGHLLRLTADDRSLRFAGGVVSDDAIHRYVAGIRFGTDALLAMLDDDGAVVALAHGCVYRVGASTHVEVAFSVDAPRRRAGMASALMAAMQGFARTIGADSVVGM